MTCLAAKAARFGRLRRTARKSHPHAEANIRVLQ